MAITFATQNLNDTDHDILKKTVAPNTLIGSSAEDACGIGNIITVPFDKIELLARTEEGIKVTLKDGETYELFDFVIV